MIDSASVLAVLWLIERALKYFIIYIRDRAKEDRDKD